MTILYDNSDERIGIEVRSQETLLSPATRGCDGQAEFRIDYNYDLAGQLASAKRYFADGFQDYSYNYSYIYDPMGNPLNRTNQGQSRNYTANNLNQLTSATSPTATDVTGTVSPSLTAPFNVTVNGEASNVDLQGRWYKLGVPLAQGENTITAEAKDRFDRTDNKTINLTLDPAPVFTYDANGNMTGDGIWAYTWNDENRLVQQVKADTERIEYSYDGLGRMRVEKSYTWNSGLWVLSSEIHFVYDGNCIIAELDGSESVIRSYVWGLGIDGGLGTAGGVGGLLLSGDELACCDGNGNITAMVDTTGTGNATYTCEYSPFGEVVYKTGSTNCPFGFSTQYTANGLVHYLYRKYSPEFGRWMSRDPIGEDGGLNLYAFVANNSISKFDVLGLKDDSGFYVVGTTIDDWFGKILQVIGIDHVDIAYDGKVVYVGKGGGVGRMGEKYEKTNHSYKLSKSTTGKMKYGKKAKCNCDSADDSDILDCLQKRKASVGKNCQGDVQDAVNDCCLKGFKTIVGTWFTTW